MKRLKVVFLCFIVFLICIVLFFQYFPFIEKKIISRFNAFDLVKIIFSEEKTSRQRCSAEKKFRKVPVRQGAEALLPYLCKFDGKQNEDFLSGGGFAFYNCSFFCEKPFVPICTISDLMQNFFGRPCSEAKGEILVDLLAQAKDICTKLVLVGHLPCNWTPKAKAPLIALMNEEEFSLEDRYEFASALINGGRTNGVDYKTNKEAEGFLLGVLINPKSEKDLKIKITNLLLRYTYFRNNENFNEYSNKLLDYFRKTFSDEPGFWVPSFLTIYHDHQEVNPLVVKSAFDLLEKKMSQNSPNIYENSQDAEMIARYLHYSFFPLDKAKYKKENQLQESYYKAVIDNAIAWWDVNKHSLVFINADNQRRINKVPDLVELMISPYVLWEDRLWARNQLKKSSGKETLQALWFTLYRLAVISDAGRRDRPLDWGPFYPQEFSAWAYASKGDEGNTCDECFQTQSSFKKADYLIKNVWDYHLSILSSEQRGRLFTEYLVKEDHPAGKKKLVYDYLAKDWSDAAYEPFMNIILGIDEDLKLRRTCADTLMRRKKVLPFTLDNKFLMRAAFDEENDFQFRISAASLIFLESNSDLERKKLCYKKFKDLYGSDSLSESDKSLIGRFLEVYKE